MKRILSNSGEIPEKNKKSTHNANNGCLGDFDRGRTHTAAILVGEVPQTCDPAVSEWRNPPACLVATREVSSARNYISVWLGTA